MTRSIIQVLNVNYLIAPDVSFLHIQLNFRIMLCKMNSKGKAEKVEGCSCLDSMAMKCFSV
jgi:hypothetical protein